jgi:hypothetical protein
MLEESAESFQMSLPKELLSIAQRRTPPKGEALHVEGWRSTWLGRIGELFVGKDK